MIRSTRIFRTLLLAAALTSPVVAARAVGAEAAFPEFEVTENFEELTVEGWTVRMQRRLRGDDRELGDRTLDQVRSHLLQVKTRVPEAVLRRLQRIAIWVNVRPNEAAQYHPSRDWLAGNGHNPDKAKCVEIADAATYLRYSRTQQSILLHELAHAYHDQVLGFDEDRIAERFCQARDEGLYDEVLKASGETGRHYALSNQKEFFAEMTESFFAANDFYPFVRAELRRHDPRTHDLLVQIWEKESPPADSADAEKHSR